MCLDGVSWLMFNLNEDPYEMANLALNAKYKAQRAKLIGRLKSDTEELASSIRCFQNRRLSGSPSQSRGPGSSSRKKSASC